MPTQTATELLPDFVYDRAANLLTLLRLACDQSAADAVTTARLRALAEQGQCLMLDADHAMDAERAPDWWVAESESPRCEACDDRGIVERDAVDSRGEHTTRFSRCPDCEESDDALIESERRAEDREESRGGAW